MKKNKILIGVILIFSIFVTEGCSSPKSDAKKVTKIYEQICEVTIQAQQDNAREKELKVKANELRTELKNLLNNLKEKYNGNEEKILLFINSLQEQAGIVESKYRERYPDLIIPPL